MNKKNQQELITALCLKKNKKKHYVQILFIFTLPTKQIMDINIEERKQKAVDYFKSGYNCSQSVTLAYADVFELDEELVKKIATSFGGGMGRLREVCGAVSGMFILLGMEYPSTNPDEKSKKTENYSAVQRTANEFKNRFGSIICADLLKIKREAQQPEADDRNAAYYQKRPCAKLVAHAAEIVGEEIILNRKGKNKD